MKFKSYVFAAMAFLAFTACSNDDEPGTSDPTLNAPDATLSIAAKFEGTKAETSPDYTATIYSLYAAVFNNEAGANNGKLLTTGYVTAGESDTFVPEITDLETKAINVKVIVVANISENTFDGATTLTEFNEKLLALEKGIDMFVMSSDVQSFSLKAGKNKAGYGPSQEGTTEEDKFNSVKNDEIVLYRAWANVRLATLKLDIPIEEVSAQTANASEIYTKTETTTNTEKPSFKVKSIFMANVKTTSKYFFNGPGPWGIIENTANDVAYYAGESADETGAYKTNTNTTLDPDFSYQFSEEGTPYPLVENGNTLSFSDINFYITENLFTESTANSKDKTLLIVKGDLTNTINGQSVTLENRYYTVVVNNIGESSTTYTHWGVKRNYKYFINLTIKGTGSNSPYEKDKDSSLDIDIQVSPWNIVNQNPDME